MIKSPMIEQGIQRMWPIHAFPSDYRKASEAHISEGDIVAWSEAIPSDATKIGIVIDTRWIMPMLFDDVVNRSETCVYPEAVVLWPGGVVTNTVMSLLRKIE